MSAELLEGFFEARKSEVKAMSITEFDLDEFIENRREEGIAIGFEKGRCSMIIAMDRQNVPRKTIAAVAGLSEAEVESILDGATAKA